MKNSVVCRALEPLIAHIEANQDQFDQAQLLHGVEASWKTVADPKARIPWADFAVFVANLEKAVGGRTKFSRIVAETGLAGDSPILSVIQFAKYLTDPVIVYSVFQRFGGPAMFPCVTSETKNAGNRVVEIRVYTPNDDVPCPQFFAVTEQVVTQLPTLVGANPAHVVLSRPDDFTGIFRITVPPSVSFWARFRRVFSIFFSTDWFEKEMRLQNDLMIQAVGELQDTNVMLEDKSQKLEVSEKRFKLAVEGSRDGIWDWDLESGEIYFSNQWYEICGYDPGYHVLDRLSDWVERVHYQDSERVEAAINELIEGDEQDLNIKYRIVFPNRKERWVQVKGKAFRNDEGEVDRMAGSLSDITELVETAYTLDVTERSYHAVIENSPDATVLYSEQGIIGCNKSMERFVGYTEQELIGKPMLKVSDQHVMFFPPDMGDLRGSYEIDFIAKNGEHVYGEVTALRVMYEGGFSYCAMIRDVTEKRRILQRAKEMDRMIAVGTMASGVAHEINNPMAYIHSNTEFVKTTLSDLNKRVKNGEEIDGGELELVLDDANAAIADVIEGSIRVRDIVRDLKSYSHSAERERPSAVDVVPIIESAVNMAAHETKGRATVVTRFQRTPLVGFNETRLSQIVLNLVINAAHSITPGEPENNEIRISTHCNASDVFIEVNDTGSGIPEALRDRIFDPFFTTKPAGQGTGLGLSICHNIVNRFGGDLTYETEVGKGTTFKLCLKRFEASVAWEPSEKEISETIPDNHIMVIDDDDKIGVMMRRVLSNNYHVTFVNDSTTALDTLRELGDVDLIISDAMMPNTSGYDLLDQIEAESPELLERFILMTGGRLETGRFDRYHEEYGVPVVFKPFDIEHLKATIFAHLPDEAIARESAKGAQ